MAVKTAFEDLFCGNFFRKCIQIVYVAVFTVGFQVRLLRGVIRFNTMDTGLKGFRNFLMGKVFTVHGFVSIKMTGFCAINRFNFTMRDFRDITMTADTSYVTVYGFMKKVCVHIIIFQLTILFINPEPSVFMTKQAILRVTGKNKRRKNTFN